MRRQTCTAAPEAARSQIGRGGVEIGSVQEGVERPLAVLVGEQEADVETIADDGGVSQDTSVGVKAMASLKDVVDGAANGRLAPDADRRRRRGRRTSSPRRGRPRPGLPETSTRPRAIAAIIRRMAYLSPARGAYPARTRADRDGDGLQRVASDVVASVATPCLHRASGQPLHVRIHIAGVLAGPVGHLLRPRLRVGPCSRRRVLGLSGQASRVALRRIAHALEPPIVHDFLLVTLTVRTCDFYAIGRARRSRPLSSNASRDCG